jgi:MFS family permease
MFGLMIGSTAFGYIADKIGRKKTLFIGILMSGTSFLIQSFLKNFWAYSMMQILTGFAAKGVFMIAFVLCMEVTGSQYTRRVGILIEVSLKLFTV